MNKHIGNIDKRKVLAEAQAKDKEKALVDQPESSKSATQHMTANTGKEEPTPVQERIVNAIKDLNKTALATVKKYKFLDESKSSDSIRTYKVLKEDVKLLGAAAESVEFKAKTLSNDKKLDEIRAGLAKLNEELEKWGERVKREGPRYEISGLEDVPEGDAGKLIALERACRTMSLDDIRQLLFKLGKADSTMYSTIMDQYHSRAYVHLRNVYKSINRVLDTVLEAKKIEWKNAYREMKKQGAVRARESSDSADEWEAWEQMADPEDPEGLPPMPYHSVLEDRERYFLELVYDRSRGPFRYVGNGRVDPRNRYEQMRTYPAEVLLKEDRTPLNIMDTPNVLHYSPE